MWRFFSRDEESFYKVLTETLESQGDELLGVLKILDLEPIWFLSRLLSNFQLVAWAHLCVLGLTEWSTGFLETNISPWNNEGGLTLNTFSFLPYRRVSSMLEWFSCPTPNLSCLSPLQQAAHRSVDRFMFIPLLP